jgi:hypothetical protein
VQYNRRARADTQLWINWKVRHGSLTHQLPPEFHTPLNRCQLRVLTEKVSPRSQRSRPVAFRAIAKLLSWPLF